LPGTEAAPLTDITQLAAATAWRGRRIDPTGFYDLGARYYEPNSGRFLSADPMGQGESPSLYDFCGGDPVNFFDPDGRCPGTNSPTPPILPTPIPTTDPTKGGGNPDDPNSQIVKDAASASAGSYDYSTPPGYRLLSIYSVNPDGSGTNAVVYQNKANGNIIIAYEGTDSLSDYGTDAANAAGYKSSRYTAAVDIANSIMQQYQNNNVIVTGHSLGGGEAALVGAATGLTTITFNAAGVDPTQYGDSSSNTGNITNYSILGEPLSTSQFSNPLLPQAQGTQIILAPVTYPTAGNALNHSMSSVLAAIGAPSPGRPH
jgi:RHS repeat-associated protein